MKIIVDEMPKESIDCAFSTTNFSGNIICKFTNCTICDVSKCKYLKPITDFHAEESLAGYKNIVRQIPIR